MKKMYLATLLLFNMISAKAQWVVDTNVRNVICNLSGQQYQPRICSDNHGGAIMCWSDARTSHYRIYAQHIDSAGYIKWAVNGIPVSDTSLSVSVLNPDIIADSAGGAIICYETYEAADRIFAVRIDSSGNFVWSSPTPIDVSADSRNPKICSDENGGAIINWYCYTGAGVQILVQWIDKNGKPHLPANGLQITNNAYAHYHSHAAYEGDSSAYIMYGDNDTLRLQRFDSTGMILWNNPVTLSNTFSNAGDEYAIRVHANHHAFVYWNDIRSITTGLYGQQINESGSQLWAAGGNAIDTPYIYVSYISLTTDSAGGDYVAYGSQTRVQRVNVSGQNLFSSAVNMCTSGSESYGIVKNDGHTGAIITWQDGRGNNGVYAQRIDSSGNLLWRSCGAPVYTAYNGGTNNDMHAISNSDGTGIAVFLYTQSDVYCAKIQNSSTVGIDELTAENEMKVFPNPSNGSFTIKLGNNDQLPVALTISDLLGRTIEESSLTQRETVISVHQPAGIYFLTLKTAEKMVTRKIVVE